MRQPGLLFIFKGEMDCTETVDKRLGNSVQLTLTGNARFQIGARSKRASTIVHSRRIAIEAN
jgi:hypothetical protein